MCVLCHKKRATEVARFGEIQYIALRYLATVFLFLHRVAISDKSKRVSRKRKSISPKDYEKLAAFRYFLRQFLRFSEESAHRGGLTPQQHQALLAIKGFPARDYVTIGELAERLQLAHHSTVGLVDRLQKHKYIHRAINPLDHRKVHVSLTAKGERVLEKLSAEHREQLRRISPQFDSVLEELRHNASKS
jgi:DNA-binding MarR family transcriptional regulator